MHLVIKVGLFAVAEPIACQISMDNGFDFRIIRTVVRIALQIVALKPETLTGMRKSLSRSRLGVDVSESARVAVVTGAAKGIEASTAVRLADDGFAVAVLDLTDNAGEAAVAEIQASGGPALAVGADVTKPDEVRSAVDRVVATLGPPAVLINNAGATRRQPAPQDAARRLGHGHQVHLRGAL